MAIEFKPFPKIPRYRRKVCVTEKLDGTNAAVVWEKADAIHLGDENIIALKELHDSHGESLGFHYLLAQSRQRFITPARVKPKNDNYGFAQWVDENQDELAKLGPGVHYGEWWGYGIQRGYGLPEKRFSLFQVHRWDNPSRPACCHVVPLIGWVQPDKIPEMVEFLRQNGSVAAPGYQRPEGVILYHSTINGYSKILLEGDESPKGQLTPSGRAGWAEVEMLVAE